jgi:homoserine kinase type II
VRSVLHHEGGRTAGRIRSGESRQVHPVATLKEVAAHWGLAFKTVCPQLMPAGSPERTLFRTVFEDEAGVLFTLEEIAAPAYHSKLKIIRSLEFLVEQGMSKIAPYRLGTDGQYIQKHADGFWQLVPYVPGVPLDREGYIYEAWRAPLLAQFLIDLNEKSSGLPFLALDKKFSIRGYIYTLCHQIETRRPDILPRVRKVVEFLERSFMAVHDELPVRFAHGDYHPLNIIWTKNDIAAVIDWEFLGVKPEIYDVSNMLGCLGMEHPSSLVADLAVEFVVRLKERAGISKVSWEHLVEFIIALRFAWLSEWLRKKDEEMIALEFDYMELLIDNRDALNAAWRRPSPRG